MFALYLLDCFLNETATTESGCRGAVTRAGQAVLAATRDDRILCFDGDTGAESWRAKPGGEVSVRGRTAVVVTAGGVCAYEVDSGQMMWAFEAGSFASGSTAAIAKDVAY